MWQVGGLGVFASDLLQGSYGWLCRPKLTWGPESHGLNLNLVRYHVAWLAPAFCGTKNLSHLDLFSGVANMQHSFCHELSRVITYNYSSIPWANLLTPTKVDLFCGVRFNGFLGPKTLEQGHLQKVTSNDFQPPLVNLVPTIPAPQASAEKGRTCLSAGCRCMKHLNGKGVNPQWTEWRLKGSKLNQILTGGLSNWFLSLLGLSVGVEIQVQLWCLDTTWEQWYSQHAKCSVVQVTVMWKLFGVADFHIDFPQSIQLHCEVWDVKGSATLLTSTTWWAYHGRSTVPLLCVGEFRYSPTNPWLTFRAWRPWLHCRG